MDAYLSMSHPAPSVLEDQDADLVSMARPLLADPDFVLKVDCRISAITYKPLGNGKSS